MITEIKKSLVRKQIRTINETVGDWTTTWLRDSPRVRQRCLKMENGKEKLKDMEARMRRSNILQLKRRETKGDR